jgi:hypothetical protein
MEGARGIIESLQQEIAPPNSVDTRITADNLRSGQCMARIPRNISVPSTPRILQIHFRLRGQSSGRRYSSPARRIFGVLADVIDAAMQTGFVRWRKNSQRDD